MIEFDHRFLDQFPPNLQSQLRQFTLLAEGFDQRISEAPEMHWPPPAEPPEELDYFVELVWQANAAKAVALWRGIVRSLNEADFLCFAVLFRALFEQALLLNQYWTARWFPKIAECARKSQVNAADFRALTSELHSSVRRSQVDWESFLSGNFDSISDEDGMDKVGLKKAADAWTQTGKKLGAFTPAALYRVLCDFGHPNFGSTLLFF